MRERTGSMFQHVEGGSELDKALVDLKSSEALHGPLLPEITEVFQHISSFIGANIAR